MVYLRQANDLNSKRYRQFVRNLKLPQQRSNSSLDLLPSGMLLSLVLLLLFFQLAKEFAMAILRFGFGAGGQTRRWDWGRSGLLPPLAGSSSGSSSSKTEISLLDAAEDDSISVAAVAGRCSRSKFCGTGARLNLAGRGAVLGGVFEEEGGSIPPSRQTPLDLDEGGGEGCGATSFSITARTTHLLEGDIAVAPEGALSKLPSEAKAAAATFLGRVSSSYTQLLQGALAALAAGDSFGTAEAAVAREVGKRPSVVKGREMFPALPLLSNGDETTPSQSPLHMANLRSHGQFNGYRGILINANTKSYLMGSDQLRDCPTTPNQSSERVPLKAVIPGPVPCGGGLSPGDRSRLSQFPNLALSEQVSVVDAAPQRHAPQHGVVGQAVDLV